MKNAALEELKAALHAELAATAGLELAFVFGSVARGTATALSDLDLAVQGDVDVLDLAARIALVARREVDVVPLARASIPLLGAIIRDGVALFERERGLEASFRTRTLLALETDGPWYERQARAWLKRVAERGILG
ncbi:MAG: nucleotidyltransferase domain-containing protein [Labilithrix sp.]|nr:nucleotidyltransferase domain-containing protein [Labilithrix sp.]MCW5812107.1 nucleotidyltransferase domain-containing protein [Labilithrix sp.]